MHVRSDWLQNGFPKGHAMMVLLLCVVTLQSRQERWVGATALNSGMAGSSRAVPSQSIMVASARCSRRCEHRPGSGCFSTDQQRGIAVHCIGSEESELDRERLTGNGIRPICLARGIKKDP